MTNTFSLAFLLALALMVALRLWLSQRQISHVLAHRAAVPAQFANRLELAAHQKAADYTVTRTRFGRLALAVEVAVLLAFTFGGGLQALHDFWSPRLDGLSYGVALISASWRFPASSICRCRFIASSSSKRNSASTA
jgi:STE24 endopeptidase